MDTMTTQLATPPAVPRVRLFLDRKLAAEEVALLDRGRSHYLKDVMRLAPGDAVALFNGRDGEWLGRVESAAKRGVALCIESRLAPQPDAVDLWLLFAPLKRGPSELIVAKAVELGASALVPVMTEHTSVSRIRAERMRLLAIEAAEQCGRCDVPEVREAAPLAALLDGWPEDRRLVFCDESGRGRPIVEFLIEARDGGAAGRWAVLIGPEGGFSEQERARLRSRPFVHPVDLGPRLLRAETAAIAALACWQAAIGDWRGTDAAPRATARG